MFSQKNKFFVFLALLVSFLVIFVIFIFFFNQKNIPILSQDGIIETQSTSLNSGPVSRFLKSIENIPPQEGVIWADFDKNQDKEPIKLKEVFPNVDVPSKERDEFLKFMSQKVFDIFACKKNDDTEVEYGMYFIFEYLPGYSGDSYDDARKALDEWGPNMFHDLHPLLFSGEKISEVNSKKFLYFNEKYVAVQDLGLEYKSADVFLDQEKWQMYYGVVDGNVIISTSKDCLFSASKELFMLVP